MALITLANVVSVILLIHRVFYSAIVPGRGLLYSAASIWATNVIVFGLWFWELDRGGPHHARRAAMPDRPICCFPR